MLRLFFIALCLISQAASEDTKTVVVGSSTVAPLAEAARVALNAEAVVIKATGTNAGFKAFCSASTPYEAPLAMASRRLPPEERQACARRVGSAVQEHKLGLNAVTLVAQRRSVMLKAQLTREHLFLALAAEIPDPEQACAMIPNPYKTWAEISDELPDTEIIIWGPSGASGTYSTFVEGAMIAGAEQNSCMIWHNQVEPGKLKKTAKTLRDDETWRTLSENDLEVAVQLHQTPNGVGIVGFASAHRFKSHVRPVAIEGVVPDPLSLVDGSYPLVGSLYIYANEQALNENPDAAAFLAELTDEAMIGPGGILTRQGLISAR